MARSKTWAVDTIRRLMPSREELEGNRWLRPVAHLLLRPALWRFTRRSVPRAIGLGLFVGILVMIPVVQPVSAALIAIPFRANVPLCAGATLASNPVTTPLLVIAALWVGSAVFGMHAQPGELLMMVREGLPLSEWSRWLLSDAAPAFLLGLTTISVIAGIVGYVAAALAWRVWIGRKWRARGHGRRRG
ncbi:DUF2062 domain-containing protein [Sphingomonas flavalba]|uniref:DUF2062 domain-containing protein n=1 Tax=Sphingomonas flavalba TaxID=2559804 RepID=UPI001EF0A487|nr:DUF2062 domain-containing protein [Sphingomonas flavalba]